MTNQAETPTANQSPPISQKNKGGRPSKAAIAAREGGTAWAKEMIDLYEAGASDVEVASALRLTEKEFDKRYKDDDLFQRLVQIGRLHAKAFWYKQSRLGLRDRSFNGALYIKIMQNRYGWSDKSETTERKPADQMSEDELKTEIDGLMKKMAKKYKGDVGVPAFTELYDKSNVN